MCCDRCQHHSDPTWGVGGKALTGIAFHEAKRRFTASIGFAISHFLDSANTSLTPHPIQGWYSAFADKSSSSSSPSRLPLAFASNLALTEQAWAGWPLPRK